MRYAHQYADKYTYQHTDQYADSHGYCDMYTGNCLADGGTVPDAGPVWCVSNI
jgi:hypothetical protein